MCECGCPGSWQRYTFPGPGGSIYLLTLAGACENCDAPSGVSIERLKRGAWLRKYVEENPDHIDGPLKFESWPNQGSEGVGIVTGFRKHEFIKALLPHLVGLSDEDGKIDECGADVILEEMYSDAVVKPHLDRKSVV